MIITSYRCDSSYIYGHDIVVSANYWMWFDLTRIGYLLLIVSCYDKCTNYEVDATNYLYIGHTNE